MKPVYSLMPWRAPGGPGGFFLPCAVMPSEHSPSATPPSAGGMSTMTQWQNSTRGRLVAMTAPSLLKLSSEEGTSTSMQRRTSDLAPFGMPDQESCGLRFWPSFMCPVPSGMPKAQRAGMRSL